MQNSQNNFRSSAAAGSATQPQQNRKAKKQRKFLVLPHIIAMIMLLALFIGGAYWGTVLYTRHGEEVAVPDIRGLNIQQASRTLEALGLDYEIRDSIYTKEMAPNLIYSQSVNPGEKVKIGRVIYLTINSSEAPSLTLPDIADNSSYREACSRLRAMGFTLGSPEYIDGEKDWVYSVKCGGRMITAGSKVPLNQPVILVIGNGRSMIEEIEFGDLYGDTTSMANEILEII